MNLNNHSSFTLTASCRDQLGIVADVAVFIRECNGSITEADQYQDPGSDMFFMRYVIALPDDPEGESTFRNSFASLAEHFGMQWSFIRSDYRKKAVLLVSKFDHCLAYLLHRHSVGDMQMDIPCVISNHDTLRPLVEWYGIPFIHIPVPRDAEQKQSAFQEIAQAIESASPDVIVLARYMQIFPGWLCKQYEHKVINIHHSFLPSFIGARPYHQAEARGVKLIGATCHYVTEDLDAGPIIEQDVVRIRHNDSIEKMMRLGKDVENTVLARGLRNHLENRILVQGNKTILFE